MQNFVWMCICAFFFFPNVKVQSLSSASQRNMKSKKGLKKHGVRGSRSLQAQYKPLSPGETISDFTLINRRLCFHFSGKALKNSAHLPSQIALDDKRPWAGRPPPQLHLLPLAASPYTRTYEDTLHGSLKGSIGGSRAQQENNKATFMIEDYLLSISQDKAIENNEC